MRFAWTLLALAFLPSLCMAEIKTETVTYKVGDKTYKGYLAYDDAVKSKRPGILVVHEFWGINDYAKKRAEQLAGMGYVAFAADMYGDAKLTNDAKEAAKMAGEMRMNPAEWLARANASLQVLRDHPLVDSKKLAGIGYCFGGSTVLSLANSGSDIAAVVSFHGALPIPEEADAKKIKAKILICHGAMDSFIKEDTVQKMRGIYDKNGVDYQMTYYGGQVHSFTVPDANTKNNPGLRYDAATDRRSWAAMKAHFDEAFKK